MKELHNNIFSNTTCISKETMLKYINKQLDKEELYQVEKHLLDCELCTDAMEGMKYAQNSSVLFAINHKIDQRAKKKGTKRLIINNLMVAASILVIVFGSYFTFHFFNHNLKHGNELAANNQAAKEIAHPIQKENFIHHAKDKVVITEQLANTNLAEKQPLTPPTLANNNRKTTRKNNKKLNAQDKRVMELPHAKKPVVDDEVAAAPLINNELEEIPKAEMYSAGETTANQTNNNKITTTATGVPRDETLTTKKSKKKLNDGKDEDVFKIATSTTTHARDTKKLHTINYIETYKVIDYTIEYQNDEDFKKAAEPTSISPDFSTKADKDLADKEFDKSTIKITYKNTLIQGIHQFKLAHYKAALVQFNLILAKHPKDINALFYTGLSDYNLKNYKKALTLLNGVLNNQEIVFSQEATWYKSLTLIELKENKKAKKILKQIVLEGGFYKIQAKEQLKNL